MFLIGIIQKINKDWKTFNNMIKEERIAERRVVFWTLVVVLVITLGFWLVPKIGSILKGEPVWLETEKINETKPSVEKINSNNYVEITL